MDGRGERKVDKCVQGVHSSSQIHIKNTLKKIGTRRRRKGVTGDKERRRRR